MIQNREQLLSLASIWANEAKNDIRHQAIVFMDEMDVSEEQLAHILGISMGEMECILRGNGEITLSTLAKILIATDNMLEIKPLSATPFANMVGDYPHPNVVRQNQIDNLTTPPPSRPTNNTPLQENQNEVGYEEPPMFLDTMSRTQLVDEVIKNGWEFEIDVNSYTRSQLISFLTNKGQSAVNRSQEQVLPCEGHQTCEEPLDTSASFNPCEYHNDIEDVYLIDNFCDEEDLENVDVDTIVEQLGREMRKKPQLFETLRNILLS